MRQRFKEYASYCIYNLPVGVSFEKFLILLLILVIFINPKDMPNYIKFGFRAFYTAKSYISKIRQKVKEEFSASFGDAINSIKHEANRLTGQSHVPDANVPIARSLQGAGLALGYADRVVSPSAASASGDMDGPAASTSTLRFDTQAT